MKKYLKHRAFIVSFLFMYFLFFFVTVFAPTDFIEIQKEGFGLGSVEYGFPFVYYSTHCFGDNYVYGGLVGNILFAAFISAIAGLASSYIFLNTIPKIWTRVSSEEFRTKYHL